jgi:Flp pilus assembly protein TadG
LRFGALDMHPVNGFFPARAPTSLHLTGEQDFERMKSKTQTHCQRPVTSFSSDTRGAIAPLFALMAVPLLGLGLAALDYSRAQGTKAAIETAADAAAVAGAKMLGAPHSEIEDAVRGYLKTNLPQNRNDLPFVLTFAPDDTALTIKMNTTVSTSILGIVGVPAMAVAVETTVERPDPIKELQAPHKGVVPELPAGVQAEIAKLPGLDHKPTADEMRQAEAIAHDIMKEIEQAGGTAEVERMLRDLGNLH